MASLELCKALREAWLADATLSRISPDLLVELGNVPFLQRVRPFLASRNVLASNAMFDALPNKALYLMRRHGFKDKKRPEGPDRKQIKNQKAASTLEALAMADHRALSARRAWNVCK